MVAIPCTVHSVLLLMPALNTSYQFCTMPFNSPWASISSMRDAFISSVRCAPKVCDLALLVLVCVLGVLLKSATRHYWC